MSEILFLRPELLAALILLAVPLLVEVGAGANWEEAH